MKINAMNINGQKIAVEIDPNANRHIVVNGKEISSDLSGLKDFSLERKINDACDSLYDLPIYEDGIIHTGKTSGTYVWQEAKYTNKEETNMTSREYFKGHMVSALALENMIADIVDSDMFEEACTNYRQHMIAALETLDDRLWWEPETSTVYWQDDGSEKPLPDPDEFQSWWTETTSAWIASK